MEVRSLVGYGVSSDSEEEEKNGSSTQPEKENEVKAGGERKTRNFLLESGSASSESSSESEPEDQEEQEEESAEAAYPADIDSSSGTPVLPPPFSSSSHKLPPPPLGRSGSGGLPAGSSVFANPFKDRAEEKLNVLQKHVPLTQQARPNQIGGKRMCVAYRKDGRCRFGIRCKFAHDSDLQNSTGLSTEPAEPDNNGAADQTEPAPASSHTLEMERGEADEEEEESRKRKKHRVGLSNTLIPPKRALKQYTMQRDNRSSHC
uniref:Si:ch211-113e8.11 n=1 Tax=Astyanax mexicanus TaxID=7994 RepID=W5JZJ0_ASTMX